ncbi:MAG TPA: hypothetical protein VH054_12995 [Polyangiaceae bacterium]|jgi:hypothetical protein|nr:hypothetical protein [Polyangiaceae bacterium]
MRLRALSALLVIACSFPSSTDTNAVTVPDRATFPPVADLLGKRCGTLDCHGSAYRNLRVYGSLGLRLAPSDRPLSKGQTTTDEYDADFESIVGLEPELMSDVVTAGGASPDRLTFVRKARGTEAHKGGSLMQAGDPEDACITSWLAGHTDAAGCAAATASAF